MTLSANITFNASRTAPAEAFKRFIEAVCVSLGAPNPSKAQFRLVTNLHSDSFASGPIEEASGLPDDIVPLYERLARDPFETIANLTATLAVPSKGNITVNLTPHESASAYTLSIRDEKSSGQHVGVVDALRNEFEAYTVERARFDGLPEDLRQFHLAQEEVFATREAKLLAGHRELSDAILDARKAAEERLEEERTTLHDRETQREEAYNTRLAELEAREEELRKEKTELDDSARMHARRKNQESYKAVLERHREFKVSVDTARKRWPVHFVSVLGLAAGIALYAYAVLRKEGPDPYTIAPATLLFGSTLTFYLVWLKRWSDSHATAETNARAFEEDFSRAYWLVELMFEWAELEGTKELPPEVVEALSRGLFTVKRDGAAVDEHPFTNLVSRVPNLRKLSLDRRSVSVEADPSVRP